MHAFRSALVCLSLWSAGFAHGEGVLVYKNQSFHPDSSAPAFRYDRIEGEGFVNWVYTGKEKRRFEKTQFHIWMELPQTLPPEVTSDFDLRAIVTQRDEIEKLAKRFPNAAPIAKKSLDLHNEWCLEIQKGMVRHTGQWMTKQGFLDLQAKQAADIEAAKQLAEQKRKAMAEAELQKQLTKKQAERKREEAARMAVVDGKKAELREIQDEISGIEESTSRLIQNLKTLVDKEQ